MIDMDGCFDDERILMVNMIKSCVTGQLYVGMATDTHNNTNNLAIINSVCYKKDNLGRYYNM